MEMDLSLSLYEDSQQATIQKAAFALSCFKVVDLSQQISCSEYVVHYRGSNIIISQVRSQQVTAVKKRANTD